MSPLLLFFLLPTADEPAHTLAAALFRCRRKEEAQQYRAAEKCYKRFVRGYEETNAPQVMEAHYRRAVCLFARGKENKAERELSRFFERYHALEDRTARTYRSLAGHAAYLALETAYHEALSLSAEEGAEKTDVAAQLACPAAQTKGCTARGRYTEVFDYQDDRSTVLALLRMGGIWLDLHRKVKQRRFFARQLANRCFRRAQAIATKSDALISLRHRAAAGLAQSR